MSSSRLNICDDNHNSRELSTHTIQSHPLHEKSIVDREEDFDVLLRDELIGICSHSSDMMAIVTKIYYDKS